MKYILIVEWKDIIGDLHQKCQEFDDKASALRKANHYDNECIGVTEVKVYEVANTIYE